MSTIESNLINQPITSISASSSSSPQSVIPPPLLLPTPTPLTATTSLPLPSPPPPTPTTFYDDKLIEKFYKKEKQILLEFEQIVKGTKISSLLFLRLAIRVEKISSAKKNRYASLPSFIKYLRLYRVLYINSHSLDIMPYRWRLDDDELKSTSQD